MFGAASMIINSGWNSNKCVETAPRPAVLNENVFMYIMNHLLQTDMCASFQHSDLMDIFIRTYDTKQSKYQNLHRIQNNCFVSNEQKEEYSKLFTASQQVYMACRRLAFVHKYKKAVIGNTTDMLMNDIHEKERNVIKLYHFGSVFLFRKSEINRIVENSICNTEWMFANPNPVKNPFNNLPFSKANLYTLYFGIVDNMYLSKLPMVFYNYFLCEFNLKTFYEQNQSVIRDKGIHDYLKNTEVDELYSDILDMLDYVKLYTSDRIRFDISKDCCKCCIVKVMKSYLKLYFTYRYSLNKYESQHAFYELRHKLFHLMEHNPTFGRKQFVRSHVGLDNKISFTTKFLLDHPTTYTKFDNQEYKTTHLSTSFVANDLHVNDNHEPPVTTTSGRMVGHIQYSSHYRNSELNETESGTDSDDESEEDVTIIPPIRQRRITEGEEREEGEVMSVTDDEANGGGPGPNTDLDEGELASFIDDAEEIDYILDRLGDIDLLNDISD